MWKRLKLLSELDKRDGSIIVFVKTKYGAERMAARLCKQKYSADAIHGDLRQNKRDRVILGFRNKKHRILVATDIAARGLDIPHIEHVINYDLPQCPEDYIHRIGRTARAGAEGSALCFVSPADKSKWKAIERMLDPNAKHDNSGQDERPQRRSNKGSGGKKAGGRNGGSRSAGPKNEGAKSGAPKQFRFKKHRRNGGVKKPSGQQPNA